MRFLLSRPHRLARACYFPRIFGFAVTFIAVLLMVREEQLSAEVIPLAALQFLVYPHLVYLRACIVNDSKRAELQHLLLDALLLGMWAAQFQFKWWLLYSLMGSVCMNNTVNSGVKGAVQSFGLFAGGALLWGAVRGFPYAPDTSLLVTLLSVTGIFLYTVNVALITFRQNRLLMQGKKEIEEKNFVFQSLLALSMVTHQAEDTEKLFESALPHLKRMFPAAGFGLLVRDLNRPRVVRNASFVDVAAEDQQWLLEELRRLGDLPRLLELRSERTGDSYCVLPMKGHLKQSDGIFVIRSKRLDESARNTITLFLEQLAAALENQLLTAQLRRMASTDPLTGVFNRAYFENEWQRVVRTKQEYDSIDFALLMVDINGLKEVNDLYGHEVGDRLIERVASLLQDNCRATDLVFRFGGDEFLILCPSATYEDANVLLKRIRAAEEQSFVVCGRNENGVIKRPVHISLGLASSSECNPEEVMKLADKRMYASKAAFYEMHARYR